MVFIPPSTLESTLIYGLAYTIPVILIILCFYLSVKYEKGLFIVLAGLILVGGTFGASIILHEVYEVVLMKKLLLFKNGSHVLVLLQIH